MLIPDDDDDAVETSTCISIYLDYVVPRNSRMLFDSMVPTRLDPARS